MNGITARDGWFLVLLSVVLGAFGLALRDSPGLLEGSREGRPLAELVIHGHAAGSFWRQPFTGEQTAQLLPAWVAYEVFEWTGIEPTPRRIHRYFRGLNLLLLALTAAGFAAACRALRVRRAGFWLAGVGLLSSFALWKFPAFAPTTADSTAVALGVWLVAAWLAGRPWAVAALALAGSFTHPLLFWQGLALVLLPRGAFAAVSTPSPRAQVVRMLLSLTVAAAVFLVVWDPAATPLAGLGLPTPTRSWGPLYDHPLFTLPAVVALALVAGLAAAGLLGPVRRRGEWRAWAVVGVVVRAVLVGLAPAAVFALVGAAPGWGRYLGHAAVQPLAPLVFQPFYFGILGVLALWRWGDLAAVVRRAGPGLALAFLLGVLACVNPEARAALPLLPLAAIGLAVVLGKLEWTRPRVLLYLGVLLLLSRVYLRLHHDSHPRFAFALLPFLDPASFWFQAACVVLGLALCHWAFRRPVAESAVAEPPAERPLPGWLDLAGLLLLAGVLGVVGVVQPDHIALHDGTGTDGSHYAEHVIRAREAGAFPGMPLNSLDIWRMFPAYCAYHVMGWTGLEPTRQSVVQTFAAFNVLMLMLTAAGLYAACRRLPATRAGFWLAGVGLLTGFGLWKWPACYPVLTDAWAPALSVWMVACWLAGWSWPIVGFGLVGAFTWPALPAQALILLLFPRRTDDPARDGPAGPALRWVVGLGIGVAAFLSFEFVLLNAAWILGPEASPATLAAFVHQSIPPYFHLNLLCLGVLFGAATAALAAAFRLRGWRLAGLPLSLLQIAVLLAVPRAIATAAALTPYPLSPFIYLVSTVSFGVWVPFAPLIFAPLYLGALGILAVVKTPELLAAVGRLGRGGMFLFLLGLAMCTDPESRHLLHFFPLVAVVMADVLGRQGWSRPQVALYLTACLVLSRFWLPVGDVGSVGFSFAWLPTYHPSAYVQALAVVAAGFLFHVTLRRAAVLPDAPVAGRIMPSESRPLEQAA